MLASAILQLQSVARLINPYNTTILAQRMPYIYRSTIYCSSLAVILANTRVSSYVTPIKPASETVQPSRYTFSSTYTSIETLGQSLLPTTSYFSSILQIYRRYIIKISLLRSTLTKQPSAQSYIMALRILLPAIIWTLNYQAAVQSFYLVSLAEIALLGSAIRI